MAASDQAALLDELLGMLREGRVQEADNLLVNEISRVAPPPAGAMPVAPAGPPPRPKMEILIDYVHALTEHLGSPHALVFLTKEFDASYQAAQSSPAKE